VIVLDTNAIIWLLLRPDRLRFRERLALSPTITRRSSRRP